jgi:hypothetical protein
MSSKEVVIPLGLGPTQLFIVLIFIILVYVAHSMYNPDDRFMSAALATLGGSFMLLVYYGWGQDESFVDYEHAPGLGASDHILRPADNDTLRDGRLNFNDQDRHLNTHGNISWEDDAGYVTQTDRDLAMESDDLDNTDVVRAYTEGGVSRTHMPLEATSSDFHSVRQLAYNKHPGYNTGEGPGDLLYSEYQVPLSDRAINMDDKMARKQHHRADMNKKAIDGAVRSTRDKFDKYFANELPENESREWWGGDALDKESDFKYYE